MVQPKQQEALGRFLGELFGQMEDVLPCGVSPGILFERRVVTKHPLLKDLIEHLRALEPKQSRWREPRGPIPVHRKQGYVKHVRSWKTQASWKGRRGTVEILKHWKTGHVIKLFTPDLGEERVYATLETTVVLRKYGQAHAELVARQGLEEVLSEGQRRELLLSDAFVEVGRSGVHYLIRRNRPTLAYRKLGDEHYRPLCALCLHPLLYYDQTWAGGMPPSDEMLVHLMLIRADEHLLWRKANQIDVREWNSGL